MQLLLETSALIYAGTNNATDSSDEGAKPGDEMESSSLDESDAAGMSQNVQYFCEYQMPPASLSPDQGADWKACPTCL